MKSFFKCNSALLSNGEIIYTVSIFKKIKIPLDSIVKWQVFYEMGFDLVIIDTINESFSLIDNDNTLINILNNYLENLEVRK